MNNCARRFVSLNDDQGAYIDDEMHINTPFYQPIKA